MNPHILVALMLLLASALGTSYVQKQDSYAPETATHNSNDPSDPPSEETGEEDDLDDPNG